MLVFPAVQQSLCAQWVPLTRISSVGQDTTQASMDMPWMILVLSLSVFHLGSHEGSMLALDKEQRAGVQHHPGQCECRDANL